MPRSSKERGPDAPSTGANARSEPQREATALTKPQNTSDDRTPRCPGGGAGQLPVLQPRLEGPAVGVAAPTRRGCLHHPRESHPRPGGRLRASLVSIGTGGHDQGFRPTRCTALTRTTPSAAKERRGACEHHGHALETQTDTHVPRESGIVYKRTNPMFCLQVRPHAINA